MKSIDLKFSKAPDYFVQTELDRLRANIGFSGTDKKVIMFTSCEPNEGKSFVSINIWRDLARAGKRVCFVDADMRKSTLRSTLHLSTGDEPFLGLSHFLSGQVELKEVVYSTPDPNAYLIPTVTMVNPSILLDNDRFANMLAALRRDFDYVIVDTPPVGIVSDGQVIASKCDGCILVVRAHSTRRAAVKNALTLIEKSGTALLGVVLNRVDNEVAGRYYKKNYYSKNYYGKGYRRGYYGSAYYYANSSGKKSKDQSKEKTNDGKTEKKAGIGGLFGKKAQTKKNN